MRNWNTEDLIPEEEKLVEVWLELVDDYDTYYSPRRQLVILIDDLILSLEKESYGDFKDNVNKIQQQVDDISNSALSDVKSDISSGLPDIDGIEDNREKLKETLNQSVDFDTSPICDLDDWWIDIDDLKSRIYSQTAAEADAILFSELKDDQLNQWNEIRTEISSEEVIEKFIKNLVSSIEKHLNQSQVYGEEELKEIIEPLFAELQYQNWQVDDIKDALKQYITISDPGLNKKRDDFLDKIKLETDYQTVFVGLPKADLGEVTPLDVGDVTFYSLSDDEFNIQSRKHPCFTDFDLSNIADVWASSEVQGGSSKIRARNLKEKVACAVDVFNLGKSAGTLQFPFDESYKVLQETSDGKILPLNSTNDLRKIPFSEFTSNQEIEDRVEHFEKYLTGSTESPLEESVASSIRWYRYADRSPEDEEQFLKYIISIESLLVKEKSESKADNIADRAVSILQFHTEFRRDKNKFFKEAYDIRSQIVHSGVRNLPEFQKQLSDLKQLAAQLIWRVQEYSGKCESIHEVLEEIEAEEKKLRNDKIDRSPLNLGDTFSFEAVLSTAGGTEVATIQLDGEFKDDGKYLYYEADVVDGNYRPGIEVSSDDNYNIEFEFGGDEYIGRKVEFPGNNFIFLSIEQLEKIRWYELEAK